MVEVAEKPNSRLGPTVETEIRPTHTGRSVNLTQQPHPGIQRLEHSLAKLNSGAKSRSLGAKRWWKHPFLDRLLVATQAAGDNR